MFLLLALIIITGAGFAYYLSQLRFDNGNDKSMDISWTQLAELQDGETEPPWYASLQNSLVKIPGYIVPLSDNLREIDEFLLVPDPMSCIHVPAPPANQIVLVSSSQKVSIAIDDRAFWVTGMLSIESVHSTYGKAHYKMRATHVEKYSDENE